MDTLKVEWLIVADGAQVVGGKLYVLGGGWDVLTLGQPLPAQHLVAVAVAIRVPWTQTNKQHTFRLLVQHEDGDALADAQGSFEVGRPPGLVPGQPQRAQLAITAGLQFQKLGMYAIVASVNGEEMERTWLRVAAAPGVPIA